MTPGEIIGRLLAWRRRNELEHDLAEDLAAHVELLARDLEHDGMTPADALAAARRQVGNVTSHREHARDYWGFPVIEALRQDLRYAVRGLTRSPGFTATVIVTLGLGIGANAAMFAVIDRVMFRPYPYMRDPGSVNRVYLQTAYQGRTTANTVFPYRRYLDLSRATRTIERFAAMTEWRFAVGTGDDSRVRKVAGVNAEFFTLFDAPPARGRYFTAAEASTPVGTMAAVISHAFWVNDFNSADVIGRTLKVGMLDFTIVGVAPPEFVGTVSGMTPDVFVPITTIPSNLGAWSQGSYLADYSWDWTEVLVRRKPGVSAEEASAELTTAYIRSRAQARALNPRVLADSLVHPRAIAGPVKSAAGPHAGRESRVLLWATGVAAIVLLIACANVANLMFVRVIRRRREITVRLALGVSRRRLVAQFVTEALLLAALGCASGVIAAQWGGAGIRSLLLSQRSEFSLATDWRTLGVAIACTIAAVALTVIGPAVIATRTDLASTLKSGAREGTYQRSRVRTSLLVLQGALSVALLIGAALFVQSFRNARSVPLGYDASPVLEVVMDFRGFPMDSARSAAERRRMLAVAQSLPGVAYATRVNSGLFGTNTADLRVPGIDSVERLGRFNFDLVSPDYFHVMRTAILRGRAITDADRAGSALVAVVSEAMGRTLWPGKDPLGQCIHVGFGARAANTTPCTTVVGIAENTVQHNLGADERLMYYMPVEQIAPAQLSTLRVRLSSADVATHIEGVRRTLTQAMPGDGFVFVRPLQEVVDDQSRSWRLGATLFVAFGVLALVVAVVGLYGVVSYNVAQQTHDIGVRVALGARALDVVRLVMTQALSVVVAGVAIGLVLPLLASRWVEPLLFRQSATDPATYAGVGAAMIVVAIAASAIPALRAVRVDPNVALRSD